MEDLKKDHVCTQNNCCESKPESWKHPDAVEISGIWEDWEYGETFVTKVCPHCRLKYDEKVS